MFESLLKGLFGSKHERDVKRVAPMVEEINRHAEGYRALSDEALRGKSAEFRARLAEAAASAEPEAEEAERRAAEREALDELLPEAFAAVKETCRRLIGRSWEVVGIP